jgi:dihydrofolate synthase/folylpolyglutamate synthase
MPERTLDDWLRHLERIHPREIDLGLGRVGSVGRSLGLLPFAIPSIIVAGTNGKGSVVHGCDALLRGHGLRTGRYTSPHLLRFNERIVIDGAPASDEHIVEAFVAIEAARGETTVTYFEFATLAALWLFRRAALDVVVLEVGLGGRLDAVNLVDADLAVITAIDLDHQHWLGDTVEQIAPEKAAVARSGRPVVLAEKRYPKTLFATLASLGAVPSRSGDDWSWHHEAGKGLTLAFDGAAGGQAFPVPRGLRPSNIAAALRATALFLGTDFSAERARAVLETLHVPARCERRVIDEREVVIDVAHNAASMEALADFLCSLPTRRTVALFGAMKDKDIDAMALSLARAVDGACAVALPGTDRAADPDRIWQALDAAGIAIAQADYDVAAVWQTLLAATQPGDRLVVCGSFYTVAGILGFLPSESRG